MPTNTTPLRPKTAHAQSRLSRKLNETALYAFAFLLVIYMLIPFVARAQSNATDAAMDGYVTDPSGNPAPNAHVIVTNLGTNISTDATSDPNGYYRFPILKIGKYQVKVHADGFSDLTKAGITLEVGSTVRVDARLTVGSTATTIEVQADASVLDTSAPTVGATINAQALRVLPITSRNVYNYAFFSPGVVGEPTSTFSAPQPAFDGTLSAQLQLDGLDNTQRNAGNPIRLVIATPEVLEQSLVIVNGATAEFGRSAGGITNDITRSGGNQYHGQVLYAFRPNALIATNALITTGKPSSKWLDYDGNVGGPIIRNRVFFFANFEYNPLNTPISVAVTPANAAILGIPASELGSAPNSQRYPTPSVRVDYKINDKNSSFFRWNAFSNEEPNNGGGGYIPANTYLFFHDRMQGGEAQLATTLTPTLLNELRFGVAQRNDWQDNMLPPTPNGVITSIASVAQIGVNPYAGNWLLERNIDGIDNVTKTKGKHTIKVGTDIEATEISIVNPLTRTYTFANLASYENTVNGVSESYQQATFQYGTPTADNHWIFLNFFAQDEYRLTQKLTINAGLRYQRVVWPALDPLAAYPDSRSIHTSNLDLAPRLSLSYQLTPNTVIRTAGGLYFDNPAVLSIFDTISLTNGHKVLSYTFTPNQANAPTYPNLPTTAQLLAASNPSITTYDPHYRDMYAIQSNLQVEHSFTNDLSANVQYQFQSTRFQSYEHDINLGTPLCNLADGRPAYTPAACGTGTSTTLARPNTSFGQIYMVSSGSDRTYNGLNLALKERLWRGVQFEADYAWSKVLGTNEQTNPIEDPTNLARDKGPMSSNVPNTFVLQGFFSPTTNIEGIKWLDNLKFSTMTYLHSGLPINVYAGKDLNGDQDLNDRPLFIGYNSLRGPNLYEEDLRVNYDIPVFERYHLDFYIESENLFNHPNENCNTTTGCTSAVNNNITSSAFLHPTSDRNPRGLYFGGKITF
jgi:Carboxypeptidase regulatory-like domain/TonB dependent receptor